MKRIALNLFLTIFFALPTSSAFAKNKSRSFSLGIDGGVGLFTAGLGKTNSVSPELGVHLLYFLDSYFAFEVGAHYSSHTDKIKNMNISTSSATFDTTLMPITAGFRMYFGEGAFTPYLALGCGRYTRKQTLTQATSDFTFGTQVESSMNSFGGNAGVGGELNLYNQKIYLGADIRYHLIPFRDEDETYSGKLPPGARAGDFATGLISISYDF